MNKLKLFQEKIDDFSINKINNNSIDMDQSILTLIRNNDLTGVTLNIEND